MFYANPPASLPQFPLPVLIPGQGNPDFNSEEVLAYELGYRVEVIPHLSLDLAAFYNEYDRLYNIVLLSPEFRVSPANEPYINLPVTTDNSLFGETYGTEVAVTWQATDSWRWRGSYSFLQMNLHSSKLGLAPSTESDEGSSPRHQVFLGSDLNLGRQVECGLGVRYVDSLPNLGIAAYTELDARLAWKPTQNCELALIGRNLIHAHHREFDPAVIMAGNAAVDRAVYAKVTWRF